MCVLRHVKNTIFRGATFLVLRFFLIFDHRNKFFKVFFYGLMDKKNKGDETFDFEIFANFFFCQFNKLVKH